MRAVSRQTRTDAAGTDGQCRHPVAARRVPDADGFDRRRDQPPGAGIDAYELLALADGKRTHRLGKRKVPDSGAVALHRARKGKPPVLAHRDPLGLRFHRIEDVETALEILDQHLGVERQVPADEVAGDPGFLVA